jgi:DNA primase
MTAVEIASRLPKWRKSGSGYLVCCPAHKDDNPSLSITDCDGKLLVHCHAGCTQEAVISALRALGLWPDEEHQSDDDFEAVYNLPEVLENPINFVCEGEKDCETLRSHGFVATTNAGGAKARWLPEFTEALRGREVIIVPDNDGPGWERAALIAKALFGSAVRIRVHDLPRETKDISDWFAAGHCETELIAILEGVHAV